MLSSTTFLPSGLLFSLSGPAYRGLPVPNATAQPPQPYPGRADLQEMTAPFPFHPGSSRVGNAAGAAPRGARNVFWDLGRVFGISGGGGGGEEEGAAPGRSRSSGRLRMEQPEHSARSIYGETLGTTSPGLREASLMEAFQAGPNSGNIPGDGNHLGVPTEHPLGGVGESRGEQRLPKPSLPCPALPCIPAGHLWVLIMRIKTKLRQSEPEFCRGRAASSPGISAGIAAGTQTPPEVRILTTNKPPKMGLRVKFYVLLQRVPAPSTAFPPGWFLPSGRCLPRLFYKLLSIYRPAPSALMR